MMNEKRMREIAREEIERWQKDTAARRAAQWDQFAAESRDRLAPDPKDDPLTAEVKATMRKPFLR